MSLVRRTSALELEIMMKQAVQAAEHDQGHGTPYLGAPLITKLKTLYQSFSAKTFAAHQVHARHREVLEQRSAATERLTRTVRNVHLAFNRYYEQEELGHLDHSEFGIPDGAARESSTRTPVWVEYADRILRGWQCRIDRNAEPLPLHVIHEALITQIQTQRDQAHALQFEGHTLAQELSALRADVGAMRPAVTKMLRLVRMSLEVALFEVDPAKTRKIMEGYGYAYQGSASEDGSGTITEPSTENPEQPETPDPTNESPNGEPPTNGEPGGEPTTNETGETPQSEEPTNESPNTEPPSDQDQDQDQPKGQGNPPTGQNSGTQTPDTQQNPNTGSSGNGPKGDEPLDDGRNKTTDPDELPAYDIFGPADEDEELQALKMIREPGDDHKSATTKQKKQGGATK